MQVFPINYSNTNSHKIPVATGRNSAKNVFANSFQSIKKDCINFTGHNLKELNPIERIKLTNEIINNIKLRNLYIPRKRIVRNEFYGTKGSLKTDYHLQLAQYLLQHKVMEVINEDLNLDKDFAFYLCPDLDFNGILTGVTAYAEKDKYGEQYIDEKKTKANAEAIMDYADLIIEHPIYNHKFVKAFIFHILSHVKADNINQKKFMADKVAKHPETLENERYVYNNLVTKNGYEKYKDMGYILGQNVEWGEEFFKTEDFRQSAYYKMFGTPKLDNEFDEESSAKLSLDSIFNKVTSTKFRGLSQDEADYLAEIMNIEDSSILFKLGEDTPEAKKLFRELCFKYRSDVGDCSSESKKLFIIITTLKNV